jgi:hypothetical protein
MIREMKHLLALALLLTLVGGCTEPNPFYRGSESRPPKDATLYWDTRKDGGGDQAPPVDGPPTPDQGFPKKPTGVDVLIVVDNSGGMDYAQQWLAVDIDTLITGLESMPGGTNYRIGVTTTDMGTGPYSNSGCTAKGDNGKLVIPSSCTSHGFSASYVEKVKGKKNVVSGVDPAVSCLIKSVGTSGCGFEQPLKAMRAAIGSSNPGFIRHGAALSVIILTNEDDCSTTTNSLFNSADTSLGAYKSYRCFQQGMLCNGQKPPCATTVLGNCKPGQKWLYEVKSRYADYVKGLKPNGWVSVLVLAGPIPSAVQVVKESVGCTLGPSCTAGSYQKGDPALRLEEFTTHFNTYGGFTSICATSYRPSLTSLLQRIKSAL